MAGALAAHHARWATHNSPVSVLGPRQARSRELDSFVASARLSAREQTPAQHCQQLSSCLAETSCFRDALQGAGVDHSTAVDAVAAAAAADGCTRHVSGKSCVGSFVI